jgi:hypothetical protein
MNNKLLVSIGALLLSSTLSAAENKQASCKITDEMKLAIAAMCSLEPSPSACESEAIKLIQQETSCKAGE